MADATTQGTTPGILRFDKRAADNAFAPKVVQDRQQAYTDISGSITTGSTAQQLAAADAGRSGIMVQNQSTADLWVSEVGTAAGTQPSIRIRAGAMWVADVVSPGAYSIWGATTGQAWAGRSW